MKVGFVGIIGKPNAGKSTLLNAILGEDLSIVTPKAQTTRKQIIGIYNDDESQIIFVDTPGITEPRDRLNKLLVENAERAINDVDIIVMIIDATRYMKEFSDDIKNFLENNRKPIFLLINKIDKIRKAYILPIIEYYRHLYSFNEILPISAKYRDGVDKLIELLKEYLPEGEPFYDQDIISTQNERTFVEEYIREGIFYLLKQELPYSIYVKINEYKESDEEAEIFADIYVEKDSQKKIVVGRNGSMIKQIREYATDKIAKFINKKVKLHLWVKVNKHWKKNITEKQL